MIRDRRKPDGIQKKWQSKQSKGLNLAIQVEIFYRGKVFQIRSQS